MSRQYLEALNSTQVLSVLDDSVEYTVHSLVPPLVMESVLFGIITIAAVLGLYTLWDASRAGRIPFPRVIGFGLLATYAIFVIHWALEQTSAYNAQAEQALGLLDLLNKHTPTNTTEWTHTFARVTGTARNLPPLVTESALFGTATIMFVGTLCAAWTHAGWSHTQSSLILGAVCLMYTLSTAHWGVNLGVFSRSQSDESQANFALLGLLSANIWFSDTIVLWRMCIVWEKRRTVLILSAALLCSTTILSAVNLAQVIQITHNISTDPSSSLSQELTRDPQKELMFGYHRIGIVTVLISSLVSNVTATSMIAYKTWRHRRRVLAYMHNGSNRTRVERILALMVESGALYAVICTTHIICALLPLSSYDPLDAIVRTGALPSLKAVDHFDAAMPQLMSIYPMMIITLVALDRAHVARHAKSSSSGSGSGRPVPLSVVIDVERNTRGYTEEVRLDRTVSRSTSDRKTPTVGQGDVEGEEFELSQGTSRKSEGVV
ncbi:unnamed protein product [Peniophora sp. CBMAI 1063]|nr:unnamed protein product [Peniophora sp. CBMAI 1063]